jgi:glycosyltransferase involved in cell wall biosynthesis
MSPHRQVLFVIDELEVGGAQRQILLLGKALIERGFAVAVIYFRREGAALRPAFEAQGFRVLLASKRFRLDPLFVWRLARLLGRERGSACLSFGFTANLWTRLAGWLARVPPPVSCVRDLVYVPRLPLGISGALRRLERWLSRRSRWVVSNSRATAESLLARSCVPGSKLQVIDNAVEMGTASPREAARPRLLGLLGATASGPVIGTLARLVPIKDLHTLLRAARAVVDRFPKAVFVLGGEGPERRSLLALSDELGLARNVFLPGPLPGAEVIAGFDVAVLTSIAEGLPNFLLEAMAAGVPVVSTRAGGVPDLLEAGELGLLAPVGDPAAIASAICWVLEDPRAAEARAVEALRKVQMLTPASVAGRYLSLFGEKEVECASLPS